MRAIRLAKQREDAEAVPMTALSYEEIVRGLVARNVPREQAEEAARREVGMAARLPEQRETAQELPDFLWPFTLTIPWSCLVSDNAKFRATRRGEKPCLLITERYADGKEKIATLAKRKTLDAAPVEIPLRLVASVFMPDNHPHDMTNFCKIVHDALERVVYRNDRWLHDVHWQRAGVDVDAPRAEITITPLTP